MQIVSSAAGQRGCFSGRLGTKYRDIADGNAYWKPFSGSNFWLGTKYRDIADGNSFLHRSRLIVHTQLGTKYRDIADGNCFTEVYTLAFQCDVGNQVPRYSGWKQVRIGGIRCI